MLFFNSLISLCKAHPTSKNKSFLFNSSKNGSNSTQSVNSLNGVKIDVIPIDKSNYKVFLDKISLKLTLGPRENHKENYLRVNNDVDFSADDSPLCLDKSGSSIIDFKNNESGQCKKNSKKFYIKEKNGHFRFKKSKKSGIDRDLCLTYDTVTNEVTLKVCKESTNQYFDIKSFAPEENNENPTQNSQSNSQYQAQALKSGNQQKVDCNNINFNYQNQLNNPQSFKNVRTSLN